LPNGVILASQVRYAETFAARLLGMMLKKRFPPEYDALLLTPCNSIHTFFMLCPLDVFFLDNEIKVLRICENLAPGKGWVMVSGAKHVLELAAGCAAKSGVKVGDKLIFTERERRG